MPPRLLAPLLATCLAVPTVAAALPATAPTTARLDTIEVAGEQPGPGLWRVQKGDRVLWLIGTLSPVPKAIEWKPAELQARLDQADAILGPPGATLDTGRNKVGNLLLLPSALGARKNPDRATLQDVLPPELYRRWTELKPTYLGRNRAVERWRPIFAAHKLHQKAVEQSGLRLGSPVGKVIDEATRRRRLPVIRAIVVFKIDDPRVALRELKRSELDDIECFDRILQRLETDIELLRARADAWATGDLDTLRALRTADPASACIAAMLGTAALQKRGFDQAEARIRAAWLASAEQALDQHAISVGQLPIGELLKPDGYLAELRDRGYRVSAPDEDDEVEYDIEPEAGSKREPVVAADP
jgi:hypothetical protein